MSDETPSKPKVTSGELVDNDPFTRNAVTRTSTIPLISRIQARSEKKTIDTYVERARSWNDLMGEMVREIGLETKLLDAGARRDATVEELETIKEGHRADIRGQFAGAAKNAEDWAVGKDLEIARKKKEIADIKKSIADLDKPTPTPQKEPSLDEKIERNFEAEQRLNSTFDRAIAKAKATHAGGGDELDAYIDRVEMYRKKTLAEFWNRLK